MPFLLKLKGLLERMVRLVMFDDRGTDVRIHVRIFEAFLTVQSLMNRRMNIAETPSSRSESTFSRTNQKKQTSFSPDTNPQVNEMSSCTIRTLQTLKYISTVFSASGSIHAYDKR